ncbi:MAG: hypothetical protein GTN74_11070 [Proteobacteria bacterium]|nr:hypothetical protein [Pseudomonadota bacterium]
MDYPQFGLIRQRFPESPKPDPKGWLLAEFERTGLLKNVKKGDRVLLTGGSRGIDSMKDVLASCVAAIREVGGEPFLCPAMGSHGGAKASMQVKVLTHLGITEQSMGAPIYSDWDIVEVGRAEGNVPVYADRAAVEADHILLVNRVKEHTEYMGDTESGILKMAVVGLGRQPGAETMHRLAVNITYLKAIKSIAGVLFKELNILGGIALLEDHRNQLRRVEAVPARDVFDREPELLKESQEHRAMLPFDQLDILLVDQIGKDISGSGFDTKVIGRIMNIYEKECETPKITRIVFRDLSEGSEGNATGLGLADYTTRRAVEKVDFEATRINCVTGGSPEKGRIPITLPTDRAAVDEAFGTIGLWTPEAVKVAWISNTKDLEWLAVSSALVDSALDRSDLEVRDELFDFPLDSTDNLPDLVTLLPKQEG